MDAARGGNAGAGPSFATKLLAISGGLATIIFLVLGFVFHAWAWAWLVFLVPGLVRTWQSVGQGDAGSAPVARPLPSASHEGDEPPAPQRYQG